MCTVLSSLGRRGLLRLLFVVLANLRDTPRLNGLPAALRSSSGDRRKRKDRFWFARYGAWASTLGPPLQEGGVDYNPTSCCLEDRSCVIRGLFPKIILK